MNAKEYLSIQSFLDEPPEEPTTGQKLLSGVNQAWEGVKNTIDAGISLPYSIPARVLGGIESQEEVFANLLKRTAARDKKAQGVDPGFLGKLFGVGVTLPAQIAALPFSAADTGKKFIDEGESLPRALAATVIDTMGNALGMALPGAFGGGRLLRAGSGAVINSAQDTAARAAIASIADKDKTKEMFSPSLETAALSAIPGAAFAALGKGKPKTPTPVSDMAARVDAVKAKKTAEQFLKEEVPVRTEKGLTLEQVPEETRLAQENLNKAAQADMFVDEPLAVDHTTQLALPLTDDPVSGMAKRNIEASDQLDLFEHKQPDVPDLRAAKEAQAGNQRLNRFGQGGAIDPDLMTLGIPKLVSGIKRLVTKAPVEDTILTPTTQANIDAKALKRSKANAIGYKGSAYDQITTKEEALANLGKDISGVTQELGAGVGGAVRRNPNNGALKYTRYNLDQATNGMNAYIKQYITGKEGFNDTYAKLSPQEKVDAFKLKKKLSEEQLDYTPEYGDQLGLTEPLKRHMESRKAAYDAMEAEWGKMNGEKGLETFEHRAGYLASLFDRNFQALVGKRMSDGSFKISTMIGAKSRREFNQALKMYPDSTIIKLGNNGRTGLRATTGKFQVADDVAFLLARMAEHDPRFAEVKQELATAHAIRDKGYKNFDVHEMDKKGVKGFLGDKPWESEATNMKDALEAEIRYFDQAAKYVHGQRLLDKTHEIVTEIRDKQPNAAAYLDKYINHVTGQNLHPIAGGINSVVDTAVKLAGHGANLAGVRLPENPSGALRGAGTFLNALLMNIYSPAMFATQMSQLYISGIPEAAKIRAAYGLEPTFVATSMAKAHYYRSLIPALDKMGLLEKTNPPAHIVEAWSWIKKHGMDDFNEVMLSQDILQSKAMSKTKQAAFWPTVLPEKFTRPTMFMWMADMFHEAGYRGQDMLNRAKAATDYSMTDYRGEEAPIVYDKMGVLTPETSALQKYKHNALDQVSSRFMESKQYPAAFLSALGLSIAFGGLLGLPAMQEIDELIIKPATKKSSREHLEDVLGKGGAWADGAASAYTQLDMGSRFALSDVAPNSFGEAVAGARLSKAYKMGAAAFDYAKNLDEASLLALGKEVMPSGLSQAYQEKLMTDKEGHLLNKKGQVQYEHKRDTEGLSKSALTGVRPLAEKQESERVWAASQRMIKLEEELAHATERMKIANNIGDEKGFDKWLKTFEEKEGNMKGLGGVLKQSTIDAAKTEKERRQGKPGKTPLSIKRFLEFED